jgi:hypothetical protein
MSNSEDMVHIDDYVYEWLISDPYLRDIKFIQHLRKHSSGCVVFQKSWRKATKEYKIETIYLHKIIAEKYLTSEKGGDKKLVSVKNGDKFDCRVENLTYRSRSVASRQRKSSSNTGFSGVYLEHNRYRAVISIDGKSVHIGMFDTAEEAALAYNKISKDRYGEDGKINKVNR